MHMCLSFISGVYQHSQARGLRPGFFTVDPYVVLRSSPHSLFLSLLSLPLPLSSLTFLQPRASERAHESSSEWTAYRALVRRRVLVLRLGSRRRPCRQRVGLGGPSLFLLSLSLLVYSVRDLAHVLPCLVSAVCVALSLPHSASSATPSWGTSPSLRRVFLRTIGWIAGTRLSLYVPTPLLAPFVFFFFSPSLLCVHR